MRQANVYRLCLALLLLAVAITSLRVILADNQPLWADPTTNVVPSVMLRDLLLGHDEVTWARWLSSTTERLWLSSVVHLPFVLVIPDPVRAVRLAELCLLIGIIWGIYGLGCRLVDRRAGLLAACLLAAAPYFLSWGRAGNADPVIWGSLLLLFNTLLELDLRQPKQALRLGLLAGLAASSRLFALVHLIAAAIWVLALAVRTRRATLNLVPAALLSLTIPGWWVAVRWAEVSSAASRSSGRPHETVLSAMTGYLSNGLGVVILASGLALAVAIYRRLLPWRQLWLFGLMIFVPAFQLIVFWDIWGRYMVSLMPLCALLVAAVTVKLSVKWPPVWRRLLMGAPLLALAAHALLVHQQILPSEGLTNADRRQFKALGRVLMHVPRGARVLVIHSIGDEQYAFGLNLRHPPHVRRSLWAIPNKLKVWNLPVGEQARFLLRVQKREVRTSKIEQAPARGLYRHIQGKLAFEDGFPSFKKIHGGHFRRLSQHQDPNGIIFTLFKMTPPFIGEPYKETFDPDAGGMKYPRRPR